jgi:hypothetical protein
MLLQDDVVEHCLTYAHLFKYIKMVYPIEYERLVHEQNEPDGINKCLKYLKKFVEKLNEKYLLPNQIPTALIVNTKTDIIEEIDNTEIPAIIIGSETFIRKLNQLCEHDYKMNKLIKKQSAQASKPSSRFVNDSERSFFQNMNATDEEFYPERGINNSSGFQENSTLVNSNYGRSQNKSNHSVPVSRPIKRSYKVATEDEDDDNLLVDNRNGTSSNLNNFNR